MSEDGTCSREGCYEPVWGADGLGLCLCHSPQNGKDELTARAVWRRARHLVAEESPDYSGWHFPPDPDGKGFEAVTFRDRAVFGGATFAGEARFARAVFRAAADFQGASFVAAADFSGARFYSTAEFSGSTFHAEATFERARFIERARFRAAFEGAARFRWAAFNGGADFSGSAFGAEADFSYVRVPAGADVVFDLPSWLGGPFRQRCEGETAYRLAKGAAGSRGDYGLAGEYHYAEQCAIEHRHRRTYGWRPWRLGFWRSLLELIFARGIFGYGERPSRALLMGLAVIVLWAFMAYGSAGIARDARADPGYQPTRAECLHFSIVTFTTVGYGDFQPKPHFMKWADAEALLGAALMSVFIVGLTRKFMR